MRATMWANFDLLAVNLMPLPGKTYQTHLVIIKSNAKNIVNKRTTTTTATTTSSQT